MIIESVKLINFGLYRGEHNILLKPDVLLNRNITVLSGQNGVGKSTLLEAIHLCLLGSLSVDNRMSELNYEKYLFSRSYKGLEALKAISGIELTIEFVKSGAPVTYKILRVWSPDIENIAENITIEENGKSLNELSKKEKNLFLRELIQPGLAKVMFFDGEKLSSLFDENNLKAFVAESCRYLFGLNFVDLLNTDLNHYINKLYSQQDASQNLAEIQKIQVEINQINTEIIDLEDEKSQVSNTLAALKVGASKAEKLISDQGRWAASTIDRLKNEKQQLDLQIAALKKELVELYSGLGPFIFCRDLLFSLKNRLISERDIDKWKNARDLIIQKVAELEKKFVDINFLERLSLSKESGKGVFPIIRDVLLSNSDLSTADDIIYHELADNDRTKLIGWIDEIINGISVLVRQKSDLIGQYEERSKLLTKEQSSFSKDDLILPILREIQEVNRQIGSNEQKLSSLNKRTEEGSKRKDFYSQRYTSLERKLQLDANVDDRLKLSNRTKLVLEAYGNQLLSRKLGLLKEAVLLKFNLLCRKESYLDSVIIDSHSFEISLARKGTIVELSHLSAGEKQLLIISILWGLRELTNISLPLIIDTPLARLDLQHRKAFVEQFLPNIQPQVILIGTDMELAGDVIESLDPHIAHHYLLEYDNLTQSTMLKTIERTYKERIPYEI